MAFWEEALFRGLIYSLTFWLTESMVAAIVSSSLLFGLFHLRNLWWADKKRVLVNCLYAGLFIGPLLAALRGYSGDIYLGILGHFLNNFVFLRNDRMHVLPSPIRPAPHRRRQTSSN